MAHHPTYADYFAAAGVPEDDGGDDHRVYGGAHQTAGVQPFFVPVEMAHDKEKALGGVHFADHRQLTGNHRATLTSLSLHGPAAHHHQYPAWQQQQQGAWHLRGSRFLLPMQQLLQEFCSLPTETADPKPRTVIEEDGGGSARIQAMDAAELQRLKAKLYNMLDEVDRRYRRYREQMRAVAGSFEAVAGARAAAAYTRLASRTISRHFRNLRDGIVAQLQATRKALGEKDVAVPGMTRGDTPRLRVLDQCIRQQKALNQAGGLMESHPWRPQRGLPERAVTILRAWLFEHFLHPYPSDVDKHILARQTGLSRSQVSNWFINARVRLWKPMIEEMYEDLKKASVNNEGVPLGTLI